MGRLKVRLITGRTIGQGRVKYVGKLSDDYKRSVAVCELDPDDMKAIGVADGDGVRVVTRFGSVILRAVRSRRPQRGIAFVPYGPWANLLIETATYGTGMPAFKGVEAEVKPAPEERVADIEELVRAIRG